MNDADIVKAFDILDKFEFFGGQRAGRELWFNKPTDVQNKDIDDFLRDLDFLKQFINRQKAEIERLKEKVKGFQELWSEAESDLRTARAEAIKEFAENLKKDIQNHSFEMFMNGLKGTPRTHEITYETVWEYIDDLVKEMTEGT